MAAGLANQPGICPESAEISILIHLQSCGWDPPARVDSGPPRKVGEGISRVNGSRQSLPPPGPEGLCQVKCLEQRLGHPRCLINKLFLVPFPHLSLLSSCLQTIYRSSSQVTVE